MARDIESGFITEVEAKQLSPIILVKGEFDSGDIRLWSGLGSITFNAESYSGAGNLLKITQIKETQVLQANGMQFTLSGIPSSIVSLALTENASGRKITAWFGVLNDSGAIVSSPYVVFSGRTDQIELDADGLTGSVILSAESDLIDLTVVRERRYTPEDQKLYYPNDKGLDFVPIIQDVQLTWGVGRNS